MKNKNDQELYFILASEDKDIILAHKNKFLVTSYWAYHFATKIGKRFPEAESLIANDPTLCVFYAEQLIKKRWKACEPTLLKNSETWFSFMYIKDIVRRPLNDFHEKLLSSKYSKIYIEFLIKNNYKDLITEFLL